MTRIGKPITDGGQRIWGETTDQYDSRIQVHDSLNGERCVVAVASQFRGEHVVLDHRQVRQLRDALDAWLGADQ